MLRFKNVFLGPGHSILSILLYYLSIDDNNVFFLLKYVLSALLCYSAMSHYHHLLGVRYDHHFAEAEMEYQRGVVNWINWTLQEVFPSGLERCSRYWKKFHCLSLILTQDGHFGMSGPEFRFILLSTHYRGIQIFSPWSDRPHRGGQMLLQDKVLNFPSPLHSPCPHINATFSQSQSARDHLGIIFLTNG